MTTKTAVTTKSNTGTYRISIVIDVEATSAEDAYGRVNAAMNERIRSADQPFEGWETCDVGWFDPDGNELSIYSIETARQGYFSKNPKKPRAPARGY